MAFSSTEPAAQKARLSRLHARGDNLQLTVAAAFFGAAVFAGCSMVDGSTFDEKGDSAPGTTAGGAAEAASEGGGGSYDGIGIDTSGAPPAPPYADGSYSYLCGGSAPQCMPGTADCAPGGNPNPDADAGEGSLGCQLTAVEGKVTAECTQVGNLGVGSACTSVAHCANGLGCVNTSSGGICRQYCCGDVEACPVDSYCAPTMMAEAPLPIPVCTPVQQCNLLDDSICKNGQVCTIVRDKGTTSCVDPGTGESDEQCPCAAGYFCAKLTNTCRKLCHIGEDATDCEGGGSCQGGVMGFPSGIGICVGYK
jgi:hypothetical protein